MEEVEQNKLQLGMQMRFRLLNEKQSQIAVFSLDKLQHNHGNEEQVRVAEAGRCDVANGYVTLR